MYLGVDLCLHSRGATPNWPHIVPEEMPSAPAPPQLVMNHHVFNAIGYLLTNNDEVPWAARAAPLWRCNLALTANHRIGLGRGTSHIARLGIFLYIFVSPGSW
jgi:hypothetical protein